MTGIAKLNYPAFEAAAEKLREKGATVISPHEIVPPGAAPWSWQQHMRADLAALLTCDVVVLLHGWETSRGAQLEKTVAEAIGLKVVDYSVTETS
jgi:nucleotide-binding universal stress UspA family protein